MAKFHGKQAAIYWDKAESDTNLKHGQNWTATISQNMAETTAMQDVWKTHIGGVANWTAEVTCHLDTAGTDIPVTGAGSASGSGVVQPMGAINDQRASLELYFKFDTVTPTYQVIWGNAVCVSVNPGADADGVASVVYSFVGIGEISWETASSRPTVT